MENNSKEMTQEEISKILTELNSLEMQQGFDYSEERQRKIEAIQEEYSDFID